MSVYTVYIAYWSLFIIVRSSCNCESIGRETAKVFFIFFNFLNTVKFMWHAYGTQARRVCVCIMSAKLADNLCFLNIE